MAFRRFRRSYRNVRRFGFRSSARYAYRKGGGSVIFGLGGAVAGAMATEVLPYQTPALTFLACLPGVLPASMSKVIPWQVRRFASGYVVGRMAKAYIGIPGVSSATGDYA